MKKNLKKKRSWLFCVTWLCVALPWTVCAQSGSPSIVLSASISKMVTLSSSPNAVHARAELNALENGGVLRLTVSGSGPGVRNLQVPVLIRSNTSYNIMAFVQSQTALLMRMSVLRIEGYGKSVAGDAVTGIVISRRFDRRLADDSSADEEILSAFDSSVPFTVFSGPRISLGGGLDSPNNALKVIFLISVWPRVDKGSWTMNLTLQGSEN